VKATTFLNIHVFLRWIQAKFAISFAMSSFFGLTFVTRSWSWSWVYLAKVKNFKDEKETIAIAKTPGHRKNRKVIESLPLDWSIKVHSKPNLHRIV